MSTHSSAAAAYKANHYESAPPLKLVRLLYEGALRFLEQAEAARTDGDGARYRERCLRVHGIVAELRLALDHGQAPELAGNLEALYRFAETELLAAVGAEDPRELAPVRGVLTTLLDGWKGVEVRP